MKGFGGACGLGSYLVCLLLWSGDLLCEVRATLACHRFGVCIPGGGLDDPLMVALCSVRCTL